MRLAFKLFFALTCFVLFVALMFVNLMISESVFPGVLQTANDSSGKPGAMLAFLISTPLPVAVCYGWYRLFQWIDRKLAEPEPARAAPVSGARPKPGFRR